MMAMGCVHTVVAALIAVEDGMKVGTNGIAPIGPMKDEPLSQVECKMTASANPGFYNAIKASDELVKNAALLKILDHKEIPGLAFDFDLLDWGHHIGATLKLHGRPILVIELPQERAVQQWISGYAVDSIIEAMRAFVSSAFSERVVKQEVRVWTFLGGDVEPTPSVSHEDSI